MAQRQSRHAASQAALAELAILSLIIFLLALAMRLLRANKTVA